MTTVKFPTTPSRLTANAKRKQQTSRKALTQSKRLPARVLPFAVLRQTPTLGQPAPRCGAGRLLAMSQHHRRTAARVGAGAGGRLDAALAWCQEYVRRGSNPLV